MSGDVKDHSIEMAQHVSVWVCRCVCVWVGECVGVCVRVGGLVCVFGWVGGDWQMGRRPR